MVSYPVPDNLHNNPVQHCTTLAITQDIIAGSGWPQLAQPDRALRNGTLTFVKSNGRTYAITCQHVVDHYRKVVEASGEDKSHSMRTMINGFHVVLDRFIQPSADVGAPPDIAIREINADHVAHIGKVPIDLDAAADVPDTINHAYAVGFPEQLKHHKSDGPHGYRVSMPNVTIIAERNGRPDRRFALFSELLTPLQDIDYSGMSGGPIFWTTADAYGLLGIIYEGGLGHDRKGIYVYGELATPDVVKRWIDQCPQPS